MPGKGRLLVVLVCVAAASVGCGGKTPQTNSEAPAPGEHFVDLGFDDKPKPFAAYFTWFAHDGFDLDFDEAAVYLWNGELVIL
jgi:hypothetical protein